MKRTLTALCAVLLLVCGGCSGAPAPESVPGNEPVSTAAAPEKSAETAAPESEAAEETDAPASESGEAMPETATESASETESETAASEEAPDPSENTEQDPTLPELSGDDAAEAALFGRWEYEGYDNIQLEFLSDGKLILWYDYSDILQISADVLVMQSDEEYLLECPLTVNDNRVTGLYTGEDAGEGGTLVLDMIAEPGTDAAALQGRYRLNSCAVRDAVSSLGDVEIVVFLSGKQVQIGARGSFTAEDGRITLESGGTVLSIDYTYANDTIIMTDEDGHEDVLHRIGSPA